MCKPVVAQLALFIIDEVSFVLLISHTPDVQHVCMHGSGKLSIAVSALLVAFCT